MKKITAITHSIDLDGWFSGAIVKNWFEKIIMPFDKDASLSLIVYNYGDPVPEIPDGTNQVIICDVSLPPPVMVDIARKCKWNLTWIDHHSSAIKSMADFIGQGETFLNQYTDVKKAACELTWEYFFPNEPMPEIVRLLGRYDCFGHKGTPEEQKVLEFQYGARANISNVNEAYTYLKNSLKYNDNEIEKVIHNQGIGIYKFLCTDAALSYKNGFEVKFEEPVEGELINGEKAILHKPRKFICINKERFNPINFGIKYHDDGYDGAACFHYANGYWNFSLYNDNGMVDCSTICKQFGGGGHAGASGFRIKDISVIIK